jgi:hypothetical protein
VESFCSQLSEMCNAYGICLKPASLERYLPAGRFMLMCNALAFVNVWLLLDQQKVTERMLENENMVRELMVLASNGQNFMLAVDGLKVILNGEQSVAVTVAALLKCLRSVALEYLRVTSMNNVLSALDFAQVLRLSFGDRPVGSFTPSMVWEYANLLNTSMVAGEISGWCLLANFRADRVPPNLDWIAVVCYDVSVGIVLNLVEKNIVAHVFEPLDEAAVLAVVRKIAVELNFPKKHHFQHKVVMGYEDIGMLHWLSQVVCGRDQRAGVNCPVELVRLQVAFELFKQEFIPMEQSFMSLIARQQQPLEFEIATGKELNVDSLTSVPFSIRQSSPA